MNRDLYGLVLLGGQSHRMGEDKSQLVYHDKTQQEHVADLLGSVTAKTFLSARKNQDILTRLEIIYDAFEDIGPLNGLLSAFQKYPNKAWLVMAIDLPMMDREGLEELLQGRDQAKDATAFWSPAKDFGEPLVTIWEPSSYPLILEFVEKGILSPRKVLTQIKTKLLTISDARKLQNINSPEERNNWQL